LDRAEFIRLFRKYSYFVVLKKTNTLLFPALPYSNSRKNDPVDYPDKDEQKERHFWIQRL